MITPLSRVPPHSTKKDSTLIRYFRKWSTGVWFLAINGFGVATSLLIYHLGDRTATNLIVTLLSLCLANTVLALEKIDRSSAELSEQLKGSLDPLNQYIAHLADITDTAVKNRLVSLARLHQRLIEDTECSCNNVLVNHLINRSAKSYQSELEEAIHHDSLNLESRPRLEVCIEAIRKTAGFAYAISIDTDKWRKLPDSLCESMSDDELTKELLHLERKFPEIAYLRWNLDAARRTGNVRRIFVMDDDWRDKNRKPYDFTSHSKRVIMCRFGVSSDVDYHLLSRRCRTLSIARRIR